MLGYLTLYYYIDSISVGATKMLDWTLDRTSFLPKRELEIIYATMPAATARAVGYIGQSSVFRNGVNVRP